MFENTGLVMRVNTLKTKERLRKKLQTHPLDGTTKVVMTLVRAVSVHQLC